MPETVAKDAVHLGQQTDFSPDKKAKGECRSRTAELRAALLSFAASA